MADRVTDRFGPWGFVLTRTAIIVVRIAASVVGALRARDPYPFILLNLLSSTQTAHAAPLSQISASSG